ncbi:MAG: hypothetical protein SPC84_06180 [Oscillospiraceae bacterium]|nr:hypothetical protein [Oscillospiraceae bacterium]
MKIEIILCLITTIVYIGAGVYFRVKKPYESASNHRFMILTLSYVIAMIYAIERYAHFKQYDTWISLADNILSGSVFAGLCLIFWRYERYIQNKYEDREKLTVSYAELAERYFKDNLVIANNNDGSNVKYPVINLGTGYVFLRDDANQIEITDNPNDRYQLPIIIENNYSKIFGIHKTSKLFNSLNIRAKSMKIENNRVLITTGRTTYFDSMVTNRAADFVFEEGLSVRSLFEMGPKMSSLWVSRLSNHLGFNGFVESADGYIVFVKRSIDVSIGKRTYGDSLGASLKTAYALDENGNFTVAGLKNAIIEEINSELKIEKEDLDENSIAILAVYRDCVECGKPQLLVYAKSKNTAVEISKDFKKRFENKKKDVRKSASLLEKKQVKLGVMEDGEKLIWISKAELKNHIIYNYESVKFDGDINHDGFVEFAKGEKRKSKVQELPMVPSASACVQLFANSIGDYQINDIFIQGKTENSAICEDGLFIGENVIAVIDGVTAKSRIKWNDKSSGLYAREIIIDKLKQAVSLDSPKSFFEDLNNEIKKAVDSRPGCYKEDWPRASVIAYIPSCHEVWSYGDCRCIIEDEYFIENKLIDRDLSMQRASVIENRLQNGKILDELKDQDFGREAILRDLKEQFNFENKHIFKDGKDYGYPVLNGEEICYDMIAVHKVADGNTVILATDGYPVLKKSLKESEEELKYLLKIDPFCYKENKNTKGMLRGNISFDDRTYVKFTVQ